MLGSLSESKAVTIVIQLFQGLAYIHNRKVCHRDIKLDNLIYHEAQNKLKIIDFGFAANSKEPLKSMCGTPSYMAPEVTLGKQYSGAPADMWACGVVLYIVLTGQYPFKGAD